MLYKALIISFSVLLPLSFSYAKTHINPSPTKRQFYVGATLGYAEPTSFKNNANLKDDHSAPNYGVLAGTQLQNWLRTGIEVTHRHKQKLSSTPNNNNEVRTTSLSSTSAFINGYFMIPEKAPYLLLGLGVSHHKFGDIQNGSSISSKGRSTSDFAYQIGVGHTTDYKNWSFDCEAKYANKGKAKTKPTDSGSTTKADMRDLIFSISTRYNF